jgi:hypothetical protein
MVAVLAGGVLATGCRPENSEVGRPYEPINQQQKSPAAGYAQDPAGQKDQGLARPDNWKEHPAHVGDGQQVEKAGQEPSGMIGDAASESATEQLEQMKKEEQESKEATGGSGQEPEAQPR